MTSPDKQQDPPAVGTVLAGKYRLDRRIGKGGMGVVYEARHLLLESQVAIKVLMTRDPTTVTRFLNEARAAARIKSDFVVSVSDVGNEENTPYMVMELLEGEDLGRMLQRRGSLPAEEAVDYVLQALAGLAEAHAMGIIHRDLKPQNLYVTWKGGQPDRVKIVDFGISKRLFDDGGPKVTTGDSVLGSPAYMAPEQLRGSQRVDGRTDIWSAGVILYELLTGDIPFNGPNAGAVFAAILENEPVPPGMLRPDLPTGIDDVVLKCLKRDPKNRYATVGELAESIGEFASPAGRQTLEVLSRAVPGFRVSVPDLSEVIASTRGASRTPGAVVTETPPRSRRHDHGELRTSPSPPQRRLVPLVLAIVGVSLVLVGAAIGIAFRGRSDGKAATTGAVSTTAPSVVTPSATMVASAPASATSSPTPSAATASAGRPKPKPKPTGDPIFGRH